jgi:hypothetical protein
MASSKNDTKQSLRLWDRLHDDMSTDNMTSLWVLGSFIESPVFPQL